MSEQPMMRKLKAPTAAMIVASLLDAGKAGGGAAGDGGGRGEGGGGSCGLGGGGDGEGGGLGHGGLDGDGDGGGGGLGFARRIQVSKYSVGWHSRALTISRR